MNFVIGKFGQSICFNSVNWSAHGGNNEAPTLFEMIIKLNPDDNFYILGKSDYSRLKIRDKKRINVHKNVFDVWEGFDKKLHNQIEWPLQKLKDIEIHGGVFYSGPSGNANIPNKIKTVKGDKIAKVLECFEGYVGPIVNYLNISNTPYFTLTPDPRYHPIRARDLYNIAQFSLSQFNGNGKVKHIKNYEDQSYLFSNVETTYNALETVFLLNKKPIDISTIEKTKKFMIVLNEGCNGGLKRGPMLKEYVLNHIDDVEIYGKWSDEWYEDQRFKGPKKFEDLQLMLPEVKYTFIIPIEKGWTTAKYCEMLHYGIIPFMHPYYDSQMNLGDLKFLRVNNSKELFDRIEYLENNPEKRIKLLKKLQESLLKSEYYNGQHLNNLIMCNLYRLSSPKNRYESLTDKQIEQINKNVIAMTKEKKLF